MKYKSKIFFKKLCLYFSFFFILLSCKEILKLGKIELSQAENLESKEQIKIITLEREDPEITLAIAKMMQETFEEKLGHFFDIYKESIFIKKKKSQLTNLANLLVYGDLCAIDDLFVEDRSNVLELINQIKIYAKSKACKTIFMLTHKNPEFYQKVGFKLDKTLEGIVSNQKSYVLLIKDLSVPLCQKKELEFHFLSSANKQTKKEINDFLAKASEKENEVAFGKHGLSTTIVYAKDQKDRLIGGLKLYKNEAKKTCFLTSFVVDKQFRGKGVSLNLYKQAEAYLEAKGYKSIFFYTFAFQGSINFLNKNNIGFELRAITSDCIFGHPRNIMVKNFANAREKAKL